jgi:hypothetical protein
LYTLLAYIIYLYSENSAKGRFLEVKGLGNKIPMGGFSFLIRRFLNYQKAAYLALYSKHFFVAFILHLSHKLGEWIDGITTIALKK